MEDSTLLVLRPLLSAALWIAALNAAAFCASAAAHVLNGWRLKRLEKSVDGLSRRLDQVVQHGATLDEHRRWLERHDAAIQRLESEN